MADSRLRGRSHERGNPKFLRNYMAELHGFIVRCYMVLPRNVGTRP